MAGSYNHAVDDQGRLIDIDDIGIPCENGGDAWETLEEFYGMVWLLAGGDPERVEAARQNYKAGIAMSPSGSSASPVPAEQEDSP